MSTVRGEPQGKGSFLDGAATTPDATGVFHYAGLNFLGPGLHLHGRHRHRVCGDARVTPVVSTGSFAPSAAAVNSAVWDACRVLSRGWSY
jgi:hypothetical protein